MDENKNCSRDEEEEQEYFYLTKPDIIIMRHATLVNNNLGNVVSGTKIHGTL